MPSAKLVRAFSLSCSCENAGGPRHFARCHQIVRSRRTRPPTVDTVLSPKPRTFLRRVPRLDVLEAEDSSINLARGRTLAPVDWVTTVPICDGCAVPLGLRSATLGMRSAAPKRTRRGATMNFETTWPPPSALRPHPFVFVPSAPTSHQHHEDAPGQNDTFLKWIVSS